MPEHPNVHLPPQTTSFIGRDDEIVDIAQRLNDPDCRLLTLVGPGGIGKTRLAIEVASHKSTAFADDSIFVPLAPIINADDLPTAIATALNIHLDANTGAAVQLLTYLSDRMLLLVLDNFEHLLDGAPFVADLLRAAPNVRILATSREPLNLQDEWLWHVKGLPFPDDESSAQFGDYEAVQLFVERARRVQNQFDVENEAFCAVRICRLVEGMPLAIELAAGWLKSLSCTQIADEIEHNLDILISPARDTPSRHRSIRAVFDHSWALLSEEQQTAFRRLSVFRGGFTPDAAKIIAGASLWMLASLVDKALLSLNERGRYDLHELLRQYGEEKLAAAGEIDQALDAHSAYFMNFVPQRLPDMKGMRQREANLEIDADFDNIRAAWLRAVETKDRQRLEDTFAAFDVYVEYLRPEYTLVRSQLVQYTLDAFDPAENLATYRFWWRLKRHHLAWTRSELPSSEIEKYVAGARADNDPAEIGFSLFWLAMTLHNGESNTAAALACLEEAAAWYRAAPDPWGLATSLYQIGVISLMSGDTDKALRAIKECHEIQQAIGDKLGELGTSFTLHRMMSDDDIEYEHLVERGYQLAQYMGDHIAIAGSRSDQAAALFYRGDLAGACAFAQESLHLARKHNLEAASSVSIPILAQLACLKGDYAQAMRLCEEGRQVLKYRFYLKFFVLNAESMTYFGLGNYPAAKQANRDALAGFLQPLRKRNMVACLLVSALLAAHEGQTTWATELLGLMFNQPPTRTGWLDKWKVIADVRADLEHKLGAEAFTDAWGRGAKLDLEGAVRRILAQKPSPPTTLIPSTTQLEPLTAREREILVLMADGLQNQEIAQQLFIALGTVKTHINAIFHKLDAANRVQAVTRARELGLLP